jgi:hypothetical protein
VSADDEQMWQPSKIGDNADDNPKVIARHLRNLTGETRDGFDRMARALEGLARIESRLDVIIDRQNVLDARQERLEQRQNEHDRRLAALELPVARVVRAKKAK